ncbi:hypothetical protein V6N13_064403 [Hibiscus sabdariffa]|uniref:Uncharacterized protein n=1 Tax=Hibiscus sabdariffa TaxID=183260 RepID=A0ABR2E9Z4_9ROSI
MNDQTEQRVLQKVSKEARFRAGFLPWLNKTQLCLEFCYNWEPPTMSLEEVRIHDCPWKKSVFGRNQVEATDPTHNEDEEHSIRISTIVVFFNFSKSETLQNQTSLQDLYMERCINFPSCKKDAKGILVRTGLRIAHIPDISINIGVS